ncbi:alpha/beta hydrolase [Bacteriovorax sp. PP10]|uniref:Alpha/beta hydrolase n=1 Tax=Bacteriovorax antarcticus TaxID=3088717 RepID=A0ABU5VWL9_9BACT|nr:alpha/beta hydrolase [Bacteriovorax sp. PP10]MEA9357459.1 alpha/beta hydrolase [Bacteriovorax sp. PP10]
MDINTLYVQTQGSFRNEAIIFLHAFPMTSDMWKEQMSFFSKTHYTLAPDLPGFGKGVLPFHAITFEHYVDAVISFLREAGIKRSIWCGLSMGGYLAMRMYERAPELCSGLILANTKAAADDNAAKEKRWSTIKMLHSHREEFIAKQWHAMVSKSSLEKVKLKKCFQEIVSKSDEEGISAGLVSLATRMDNTETLAHITVPTLILAGEHDKIIPLSEMQFLQENIQGSRLEIIKGTGHLSNMENPDDFNKVIADFLASLHTDHVNSSLLN